MAKKIKFIHTGDLHLGSILHVSKKADKNLKYILDNAVYNCFSRLCNLAVEKQVDFILISGDIYDREARSIRANNFFIEQCRKLEEQGIKVYAIGGNHDPIKKNSELFTLPQNVYIFSSETAETIEHKDKNGEVSARIIGQSYRENWDSRKMYKSYSSVKDNIFTAALLHTQLDGSNNYVPCTVSDLYAIENIHYWALGHIHKFSLINKAEPVVVYPGIPQGRDLGEEGLGGAVIVEVEENRIASMKFMPLSQIVWKRIAVSLDKLTEQPQNISDLENLLLERAQEVLGQAESEHEGLNDLISSDAENINGYIVKWSISGRSELYKMLEDRDEELYDYFIESLNSKLLNKEVFLFTDSVELNIGKPVADLSILKAENTALKAISKFAGECLMDEKLKKQLVRRLGSLWEAADNIEDINYKKLQLDEETLTSILQQAEQLSIDAILQRSDEE